MIRFRPFVLAATLLAGAPALALSQAPAASTTSAQPFVVEYYYKTKWGTFDEFKALFRKNHYPVLQAQVKSGRMTSVRTFVPTYHGDGRADWTFAVAITFKDSAAMNAPSGEDEIVRKLFPDQNTFRKEEQRRFEILDAHWDVPLNEVVMTPAGR